MNLILNFVRPDVGRRRRDVGSVVGAVEAEEEGGEGPGEAEVQLRGALERRLLPRDQGALGEVPRARNGNDHHQDWKVSHFLCLEEQRRVIFLCPGRMAKLLKRSIKQLTLQALNKNH